MVGGQGGVAPVEQVGVQQQREAGLREVVTGQVQVTQLVDVADVHLLPVYLVFVEILSTEIAF